MKQSIDRVKANHAVSKRDNINLGIEPKARASRIRAIPVRLRGRNARPSVMRNM